MINSFKNAFRGLFILVKSERNFQIHLLAFLLATVAGFYFNITIGEWCLVLIMTSIVMGLEGLNSAMEKLCDEVTLERKESIRNIKDIAAGAVLISAIIAAAIGVLIFFPYFRDMLSK